MPRTPCLTCGKLGSGSYCKRHDPAPRRHRARVARRQARLREQHVERVDRRLVWERDRGICHLCGEPVSLDEFELDHVVRVGQGGEHSHANTRPAHPRCNRRKG